MSFQIFILMAFWTWPKLIQSAQKSCVCPYLISLKFSNEPNKEPFSSAFQKALSILCKIFFFPLLFTQNSFFFFFQKHGADFTLTLLIITYIATISKIETVFLWLKVYLCRMQCEVWGPLSSGRVFRNWRGPCDGFRSI